MARRILFIRYIFFFGLLSLSAVEKTVCLNMIVKDEASVIKRSLSSVKTLIDYWVIVDTGSTDGTQAVIKDFLKDIPGELHEQPWVNFGHNRNQALELAKNKADYLLFIDADEVLQGAFDKGALDQDAYVINVIVSKEPFLTFQRALLINNHLAWRWKGVLHEKLDYKGIISCACLPNIAISAEAQDGHRAQDPDKYLKDAATLEAALLDDPNNADYVFYLAQSYQNANQFPLALKNYEKRAKMDGWDQQTFWSKYMVAALQQSLDMDHDLFIQSYSDAFTFRPTRAEPLFRLAQHYHSEKKHLLAYILAQYAAKIPMPDDFVYVEQWIYSYGILAIWANAAFDMGKYEEAAKLYQTIAEIPDLPEKARKEARSTQVAAYSKMYVSPH